MRDNKKTETYREQARREVEQMIRDRERELVFGKPSFPEHAKAVRTASGMRFGW